MPSGQTFQDTIAAPATIPGTGAISLIRLSGPEALSIVDRTVRFAGGDALSAKGGSLKFGRIYVGNELLDEVMVGIYRAPHSYTGEDSAEISCHSSLYIVNSLMELLCSMGARPAGPGEFTKRAYINGKMDLVQAEAVADLIASESAAAHKVAINQLKGGFSAELKQMGHELVDLAALMELELDFSEEEVEFADRSRLLALSADLSEHLRSLIDSFRLGNAVKNGLPVVIAGAANAGKSTLLNVLLGEERAIVTPVAGTTRDTIEECLNLGGMQLRFIDTAGLRRTDEPVELLGIERSMQALSRAAIVLAVVDASIPEERQREEIGQIASHVDSESQKLIICLNKDDLRARKTKAESVDWLHGRAFVRMSAKESRGTESLKELLADMAAEMAGTAASSTLVTNVRHLEALKKAYESLERLRRGLADGVPTDLAAQDLREATRQLGSILGTSLTNPDTLLHQIFSKHCIGK